MPAPAPLPARAGSGMLEAEPTLEPRRPDGLRAGCSDMSVAVRESAPSVDAGPSEPAVIVRCGASPYMSSSRTCEPLRLGPAAAGGCAAAYAAAAVRGDGSIALRPSSARSASVGSLVGALDPARTGASSSYA